MKHRCRASEAGSVEAGRPAAHRFFFAYRVVGAIDGQPNRASSCQPGRHESQIEPARVSLDTQGSQVEAARASQGAQGRQIEAARSSQGARGLPNWPARAPRKPCWTPHRSSWASRWLPGTPYRATGRQIEPARHPMSHGESPS